MESDLPVGCSVWPAVSRIFTKSTFASWRSVGMISFAIVTVAPPELHPPTSCTRATAPELRADDRSVTSGRDGGHLRSTP
jgi:hypothetical protein